MAVWLVVAVVLYCTVQHWYITRTVVVVQFVVVLYYIILYCSGTATGINTVQLQLKRKRTRTHPHFKSHSHFTRETYGKASIAIKAVGNS
jgi:hypothetical protein